MEAGGPGQADAEEIVRRSLAPLLRTFAGHDATAAGIDASDDGESFIFPIPDGARVDTLLLGCTHYPLLADLVRRLVGRDVAVIDSASATASALASLIEVHDLGTDAPAMASHRLLTTGDVDAFSATANRLFGDRFVAAEGIRLESAGPAMIGP